MHSNIFDSTTLGTIPFGQGSAVGVVGTLRSTLRVLVFHFARHLALWLALKRLPAGMIPAMAMCPVRLDNRQQRDQRWSGIVVDSGSVGVRW